MTLAIGTALQYGNYVIDALGLEDSVGPVYLATYIPRGRSRLLRIWVVVTLGPFLPSQSG
ncbi:MAG: hypothetical protein LVS60_10790 [Nodosilinea sp. LVE1205-7]|jgi:hypothetical protein